MGISAIVPVYNEEMFLTKNLETLSEYVDEVIVVDGSPDGPSVDETKAIATKYDVVQYFSGTFAKEDGAWDIDNQLNMALDMASGDYIMPTSADMIWDYRDLAVMCQAIKDYPEKKLFYCLLTEFFIDHQHIRLYPGQAYENWYLVPAIGKPSAVSADLNPCYDKGGHLQLSGINRKDFLYVSHVTRYHYGWVSGFRRQVDKHIRNVKMGAWGEIGESILNKGEERMYAWAVRHVLSYSDEESYFPYIGKQPEVMEGLNFNYLDGYEEAMKSYIGKFGKHFEEKVYQGG